MNIIESNHLICLKGYSRIRWSKVPPTIMLSWISAFVKLHKKLLWPKFQTPRWSGGSSVPQQSLNIQIKISQLPGQLAEPAGAQKICLGEYYKSKFFQIFWRENSKFRTILNFQNSKKKQNSYRLEKIYFFLFIFFYALKFFQIIKNSGTLKKITFHFRPFFSIFPAIHSVASVSNDLFFRFHHANSCCDHIWSYKYKSKRKFSVDWTSSSITYTQ